MSTSALFDALDHATRPATAERPSVVFRGQATSYRELAELAQSTATWLLRQGVQPGDRVALCLPKSVDAVALILGTLAAGSAYVPLDAQIPPERARRILEDARPKLVAGTDSTLGRLQPALEDSSVATLALPRVAHGEALRARIGDTPSGPPLPPPSGEALAALLYTSGSTGTPKAVMLSHANISAFVDWAVHETGLTADDRVSSHAPFHFDLSTFDLFATFSVGAAVHLLDEVAVKFPGSVARMLETERISVWYSVPTAIRMLVDRDALDATRLPALRLMIFAGEAYPPRRLAAAMHALPGARFLNWYGPTETNVCTSYEVPEPPMPGCRSIPIGQACAHLEVRLLDEHGDDVADGTTGEICVLGPAVMQGYWGRPALTHAVRIAGRPDSYRTGDFGFRDAQGRLTLVGRRDHQVKLRGHRIELGDVENVLGLHPDITEVAVVVAGDSEPELVGAVVAPDETGDDQLRSHAAGHLPAYSIPTRWMRYPSLPRTATGKVDRGLLREHARSDHRVAEESALQE
ncbi:amino acid adenylation domain-containing protein [Thioalkalivibrio paradoxus]|uniref:Thioester reductase n=1 Tax=Thioalkalivibrio paradoxus ARh 1 TaxID=713585 RepID=W0DKR7_9GAMM|nr:amino acid adenylation domain-containing protein [Thioalkalivibrio paradoxus]AHE97603.1 thioester reductase [Thioalkalivibrio paradoxus ARh 1]